MYDQVLQAYVDNMAGFFPHICEIIIRVFGNTDINLEGVGCGQMF